MGTRWHCRSQPRKPTMLSGSIPERVVLQQKNRDWVGSQGYTGVHRARTRQERNSRQREQCATDKRHQRAQTLGEAAQWSGAGGSPSQRSRLPAARSTGGTVGEGEPQAVLRAPSPVSAAASLRPTPLAPRQHSLPSTVSRKRVFTLFIVCSSSNFNINSTWAGLFDVLFPTLASEPK